MNAPWHSWGMQPEEFKRNWDLLAGFIKSLPDADRTALVWSPFDGTDYPYQYSPSTYLPKAGSSAFKILDTNSDGILNTLDDPYAPYLPTNVSSIDWIGLSIFWQDNTSVGKNVLPVSNRIKDILTGNINNGINFYATYVAANEKPMMLSSTGAVFYTGMNSPDVEGPSELEVKQSWWKQWLSPEFTSSFPALKMICLSEAYNQQPDSTIYFDFRLGNKSNIFSAFKEDVLNANNFPVQWALPANLTTWNPYQPKTPVVPHDQSPTRSGFEFNTPASYAIVGFLSAAFLLVSIWIGLSFCTHQKKKRGTRSRSFMSDMGRIILVHEKTETDKYPTSPVDDNSTVCPSQQMREGSFQSQFTTSDEILHHSLSLGEGSEFNRFGQGQDDDLAADDADSIRVLPPMPVHTTYQSFSTPAASI